MSRVGRCRGRGSAGTRTWTETAAQSGKGAACPAAPAGPDHVCWTRLRISYDRPVVGRAWYVVPAVPTVGRCIYVIRKRIKLPPEKAIFIFVDNVIPPTASLMSAVYEVQRDEDGFSKTCIDFQLKMEKPFHLVVYNKVLVLIE